MKELILIFIVAFVFVFGYLIMRKVDMFLAENNLQTKEHSPSSSLRIGFETFDLVDQSAELLQSFFKEQLHAR